MERYALIYKEAGETPLQALERFRRSQIASGRIELRGVPMTYAGRLDPMAEGQLLILIGDECKNKEKYLGLDKEYEVEIVFGIQTDTHDALGIPKPCSYSIPEWDKLVGKFEQEYPAYSSKTFKGKQLHDLARAGELPDEMPTKEVEIYSIDELSRNKIAATELKVRIFSTIDKVKGDFRQDEIDDAWSRFLKSDAGFDVTKVKVRCSAGTYMRSLANKVGGFALTIKRTKLFGIPDISRDGSELEDPA